MDLGLNGKVALVTGASRGLGKAIATRLVREGADATLSARTAADLERAAHEIGVATGAEPAWTPCDLTRPDDVDALVAGVLERHRRLDVLVVNSGGPPRGAFDAFDDEAWRDAFERSLLGAVRLLRAATPILREQRSGAVLAVTSSSVRQPIAGHPLSNALRPGLHGLLKSLALELAPYRVRVNSVAPGRMLTERVIAADHARAERRGVSVEEAQREQLTRAPLGRFGRPEELADAAAFLVSERASYVTGATLHVDGGMIRGL